MRISDWSSDVCSSDLSAPRSASRHRRSLQNPRAPADHGSASSAAAHACIAPRSLPATYRAEPGTARSAAAAEPCADSGTRLPAAGSPFGPTSPINENPEPSPVSPSHHHPPAGYPHIYPKPPSRPNQLTTHPDEETITKTETN